MEIEFSTHLSQQDSLSSVFENSNETKLYLAQPVDMVWNQGPGGMVYDPNIKPILLYQVMNDAAAPTLDECAAYNAAVDAGDARLEDAILNAVVLEDLQGAIRFLSKN